MAWLCPRVSQFGAGGLQGVMGMSHWCWSGVSLPGTSFHGHAHAIPQGYPGTKPQLGNVPAEREDARCGSGESSGSTVRDAEAKRSPWENLSALYFCAVMAQINGGPQLLPVNVKMRVLVPVPGNPSGSLLHTRPPSPPPLHQMARSGGRLGTAVVLAVAMGFSRGHCCLELHPPAPGRGSGTHPAGAAARHGAGSFAQTLCKL